MAHLEPFTRHFANLLWLLIHRPEAVDEQKGAMRQVLAHSLTRAHEIPLMELNIAVAQLAQGRPESEELPWLVELALRMAGHSVRLISFEIGVSAGEALGVARALKHVPIVGDEGAAFDARVVELGLETIHVHYGREGFVRRATPPIGQGVVAGPARTPPLGARTVRETPASATPVRLQTPVAQALAYGVPEFGAIQEARPALQVRVMPDENERIFETTLSVGQELRQLEPLFARLDAPMTAAEAARHLEEMARAAELRAGAGEWTEVLEVYKRIVAREATETDAGVKRAVTVAIRRLNQPAMLRGVALLLTRKGELREDATQVLSRYGEVAADVLLELLVSSEAAHERRAYRAALAHCPTSVPALTHMLGDARWFVVRNAAELLGEMGATDSDLKLVHALRHADARVRRAAATALSHLATPRSLHALQQALGDKSPGVRSQAAHGLGTIRNPRAVPALIEALEKEADPDVQPALLAALGSMPTQDAIDRLKRAAEPGSLIKRKPTSLRLHALQALADAGTPEAMAALRAFAKDRDKDVQSKVARLLENRAAGSPAA